MEIETGIVAYAEHIVIVFSPITDKVAWPCINPGLDLGYDGHVILSLPEEIAAGLIGELFPFAYVAFAGIVDG